MVPVIHGTGAGLAGLMAYVTHDVENHETAERVEWMEGVNLPTDDAASCERLMRRTVNDAANLKAATGSSSQGRKLRKPYEHLTLSWSPDEPHPTRQDMKDAAREAIKARGYARCQGFIAAHDDRDHPHVHIVICRVDPSTGRTTRATHARKLQRWAETHEKKNHGPALVIPNRRARRLVREHNAAEIKASVKENRAPVLRAMPRMKPATSPGPARPSDRAPVRRGARRLPRDVQSPPAGRHAARRGPPRSRRTRPHPGRGPSPSEARPREPSTADCHQTANPGTGAGEPTPPRRCSSTKNALRRPRAVENSGSTHASEGSP